MQLTPYAIDISHRLGQYRKGRNRKVIVRFVHRQLKQDVLYQRKHLKNTGITIFEDLTQLNNEVLASTKKKLPDTIEKSWYSNGNIYIKRKAESKVERVQFKDFDYWLKLDWPKE